MIATLSKDDVARLLQDPSAEARADAAAKIATHYDASESFGPDERRLAEEIFSILCRDAEQRVREALSSNLKDCPYLPHDIALTLANDVAAVSIPILKFSSVLTDEDLIEIVRSQGEEKQLAIAGRAKLSSGLSDAIVDTSNETVVGALAGNDGADISAAAMHRMLDDFENSDLVKEAMAGRSSIPVEVTERLVSMVSEEIQTQLMGRQELSAEQIGDLILQSREKATLGLLSNGKPKDDARRLIVHLYKNGRLTPTIVLRALCMGDLDFFESSIAILSRIPLSQARKIIHAGDERTRRELFAKASLPKPLLPAFAAAVEVAHETHYDGGDNDLQRFRRRMIERIITNFEDPDGAMGDDNIEYLMARLSQIDHGFAALSR